MLDWQYMENNKATQDPKVQEAFSRFASEIANKTYAKAYLAVQDCISQKEFCSRLGLDETRFSRVIRKIQDLPTNKRPSKEIA